MMSNKPVKMMSDAVLYYILIKAYILQLHIHNAKAEESSAGKKFTLKQLNMKNGFQSNPC